MNILKVISSIYRSKHKYVHVILTYIIHELYYMITLYDKKKIISI